MLTNIQSSVSLTTAENIMKTFIISYIASVLTFIFASYPAVQAAPLEVIPRICVYFGFPAAVILTMVFIALSHILGLSRLDVPITSGIPQVENGMSLNPEANAA